jgi:hypothetical protein
MAEGTSRPRYTPPPWQHGNPVYTLATQAEVKHDLHGGLRQFLAGGEELLALVDLKIAPGRWNVEAPPDERSPGRKAADRAADVASVLLGGANSPSLSKILGVESVSARSGSWAYRMLAAWREAPGLLVTDQRFALLARETSGTADRYQAVLEIPREAVANVRLAPKPLARGRVVIDFADGSLIALKYGTWRTALASRMVGSLSQWRMQATRP